MGNYQLAILNPNITGSLKTKIYDLLKSNTDNILNTWKQNPHYINAQTIGSWGGDPQLANNSSDIARFYEIKSNTTYLKAAEIAIGWFFRVNPWNISFVSGIGSHYTLYLHSHLNTDLSFNSSTIMPSALVNGPINDPANSYALLYSMRTDPSPRP